MYGQIDIWMDINLEKLTAMSWYQMIKHVHKP